MTTKERILDLSLELFSKYGYQGTSVKNIADAVGIKDSSLYKHFKSKKEIFDTIVVEMSGRMEVMSKANGLPDETNVEEAADIYRNLSLESLLSLSEQIFLYYLKDPFASRFRRMLVIEQYQDLEIYQIYREIFMDAAISYQTILFKRMIETGAFKGEDPEAMAVHFYAPIFFLLNKYDQEPEKEEEAKASLKRQIMEFARIYKNHEAE